MISGSVGAAVGAAVVAAVGAAVVAALGAAIVAAVLQYRFPPILFALQVVDLQSFFLLHLLPLSSFAMQILLLPVESQRPLEHFPESKHFLPLHTL